MKSMIKKIIPILLSVSLTTPLFASTGPLPYPKHETSITHKFSASDFDLNPSIYKNFSYEEKKLKNNTSVQITSYIKDGTENKIENYILGNGYYKTIAYVNNKEVFNENRKLNSYITPTSNWFDYELISSGKGYVGNMPNLTAEVALAAAIASYVGSPNVTLFLGVAAYIIDKAHSNPFNSLYMTYSRYHAYEDFGPGNPAMFYTKFKMSFYKDSNYQNSVYTNVEKIFKSTSGWM